MHELSRQERSHLLKEALRDVLDDPVRRDDLKEVFKEAHDEWMEKKFAEFGKWTLRGVAAAAFTGFVSLYVWARTKGLL
jgi:HEPN domain-containing protein